MNKKSRLISNSIINVSSQVFSTGMRIVLVPFILGLIGRGPYGVWVILGAFFAYANILQMGLNSSITRFLPFLFAKNENEELNLRVNIVLVYFTFLSIILAILTFFAYFYFPSWFSLEYNFHYPARMMVLIVGISQVISLPLRVYSAILAGMERFDLSSGLEVIGDIFYITIIFIFLPLFNNISDRMIFIAGVNGIITIILSVVKLFFAFRICKNLRFNLTKFNFRMLWEQMIFGINSTLYVLAGLLFSRMVIFVIGAVLTTKESADYGIAMMLILAGSTLISAVSKGIQPAASRYHGENNYKMLQELLLRSTRYNAQIAIGLTLMILLFGPAFFKLWIGNQYAGIEKGGEIIMRIITTSSILVTGFLMYWLVQPAYMVINGMGKHFYPAIITVSAGLFATLIIIPIAYFTHSINMINLGVIIPMYIAWGIFMPVYCCKILDISIKHYFLEGIFKPILPSSIGILIFLLVIKIFYPKNWTTLIVEIIFFCLILLIFFVVFVLKNNDRLYISNLFNLIRHKYHSL